MTQGTSRRVLIADDEKDSRALLKLMITNMNWQVVAEAANGQEAVDLYLQHRPDLLLLDINMPDKTGEEALEEILNQDPNATVIMLTSVADMQTVEKCIDLGASNYIRKDTHIDGVRAIIQKTLS